MIDGLMLKALTDKVKKIKQGFYISPKYLAIEFGISYPSCKNYLEKIYTTTKLLEKRERTTNYGKRYIAFYRC